MAQPLFKLIILLVAINSILYVGGVRVIGDDNSAFVGNFINVTDYEAGTIGVTGEAVNTLPTTFQKSGSGVFDFIDSIGAVGRFIAFIINIVFTPLGLFVSAGMPLILVLIFGVPFMAGLMLAVAYFIRSGS